MIIKCDKCGDIHSIYWPCGDPPVPKRSLEHYVWLLCIVLGFALGILVSYWGQL